MKIRDEGGGFNPVWGSLSEVRWKMTRQLNTTKQIMAGNFMATNHHQSDNSLGKLIICHSK
jgi:hypothetical protein